MYKKYVHPCYSWNNDYYKKVNENTFVSCKGSIVTLDRINHLIEEDDKRVKSGELETDISNYGLLDSSEEEFTLQTVEKLKNIHEQIVSNKAEIAKIKLVTGVYCEI